jgi:ribosomal protein S18 acetylase RimI-like enzyme
MTRKTITIRAVRPADIDMVHALVRDLAEQQGTLPRLDLTPASLRRELFRKRKRVFCIVATANGDIVGTVLWYPIFSILRGRWLLFVENLIVIAKFRNQGIGKNLLAHVALRAIRARCAALLWLASNSNKKAISFYESLDAKRHSGSSQFVLAGKPLETLAARAR